MRLIHCADWHLDAKMETGLDTVRARERRVDLLLTFSHMIEVAEQEGASAVLLAGDLFDSDRVTDKTRRFVGDAIASHPILTFVSVRGNHDATLSPLFADGVPPANWHDLSGRAGWERVALGEGVAVYGRTCPQAPEDYDSLAFSDADAFRIVLLHGQVSSGLATGEDRIALGRLSNRGIDYLALGHEHSARCETLDARGVWAYAGCPEGRGFDECGDKGCLLIDTDRRGTEAVRFLSLCRRRLHEIPVALDGCASFGDILSRVSEAVAPLHSGDMVKVVLTGELDPEVVRDTVHLDRVLNERFYFARVKDESRLLLRPEDYLGDISLKGEFIRTVLASPLDDEQKRRTILAGLRALRGEEVDA